MSGTGSAVWSVSFSILLFLILLQFRENTRTQTLERVSLPATVRAATPKDKATKAFHPDLPEEDAWFDPINLEKKGLNEEDAGKNRQIESWHSFETF
jgi:hypothetical protein